MVNSLTRLQVTDVNKCLTLIMLLFLPLYMILILPNFGTLNWPDNLSTRVAYVLKILYLSLFSLWLCPQSTFRSRAFNSYMARACPVVQWWTVRILLGELGILYSELTCDGTNKMQLLFLPTLKFTLFFVSYRLSTQMYMGLCQLACFWWHSHISYDRPSLIFGQLKVFWRVRPGSH